VHIWSSLSSNFCNGISWISSQLTFCLWHTLHNWRQTTMNDCKIPSCYGFVFQYRHYSFLNCTIRGMLSWIWQVMISYESITIFHDRNMFDNVFILMKNFEFWLTMFSFVNNGYKIIKIDFPTTMASKSMRSKKWWIWIKDKDISFSKHWIKRSRLAVIGLLLVEPPCRKETCQKPLLLLERRRTTNHILLLLLIRTWRSIPKKFLSSSSVHSHHPISV
jgi:hypothetical protein